jgi:hypothetical protein
MKIFLRAVLIRIKVAVLLATFLLAEKLFFVDIALAQSPTTKAVKLNNPLNVDSIEDLLGAILTIVIILATPIIVFFIIYAGFLYVTARGNAEQVTQATRALTYAVIGGVLIVGAVAIAAIIQNLVSTF